MLREPGLRIIGLVEISTVICGVLYHTDSSPAAAGKKFALLFLGLVLSWPCAFASQPDRPGPSMAKEAEAAVLSVETHQEPHLNAPRLWPGHFLFSQELFAPRMASTHPDSFQFLAQHLERRWIVLIHRNDSLF